MRIEYYETFNSQIELLSRITILYGDLKGVGFEWFWFGMFISLE